ncbi:hypothetical protein [Falsirhodobacter halotolerans]|uniref:hypothetical protein n=1 Tax=Falsirhodobacter halotolerans TaxID=1146892 RepID=UPI001FD0E447|nr:hypothetical protein [Falsirhodobacter halotolerans]MCJ8139368.1 hypothetical protein [Falsirhodobacter halotolerans]
MTTVAAEIAGIRAWGDQQSLEALAARVWRDAWDDAVALVGRTADRLVQRDRDRADRVGRVRRAGQSEARARHFRLTHATPPKAMAAAPVAPARGAMRLTDAMHVAEDLRLDGKGAWHVDAVVGGQRWEAQCQLQVMNEQARRAHVKKHGRDVPFVPPFTPGQVQMGQRYATLTERHAAGGMKCMAIGPTTGGGKGGEFMDVFLAEGRELDMIHRRIGAGQAMAVRRVRPSARGTRLGITDRRLVDMVCLGGMDVTAVLERHGWATFSKPREALRAALAAALERMQGIS